MKIDEHRFQLENKDHWFEDKRTARRTSEASKPSLKVKSPPVGGQNGLWPFSVVVVIVVVVGLLLLVVAVVAAAAVVLVVVLVAVLVGVLVVALVVVLVVVPVAV